MMLRGVAMVHRHVWGSAQIDSPENRGGERRLLLRGLATLCLALLQLLPQTLLLPARGEKPARLHARSNKAVKSNWRATVLLYDSTKRPGPPIPFDERRHRCNQRLAR